MANAKMLEEMRALPAKQQIALWVILREFHSPKGTWFSAGDFFEKARKYLTAGESAGKEEARILGGILSSLVRNGMISQLSGGRKPIWQVVPELHKNASEYAKAIFPVVTYWESENR